MTAHALPQGDSPAHSAPRSGRHRGADPNAAQAGPLTGLPVLLGFMLRRDRWRGPIWVLSMAGLMTYFANALGAVMDQAALDSMQALTRTPVMGLVAGREFDSAAPTLAAFIATKYGVYLMLGAALMSITTVARHTRAEEQTGRAELVRASVAGRHCALVAALILAFAMNIVMSVLMSAAFWFSTAEPDSLESVLLFCVSVGAVGFVFASITAITIQLSAYSRGASGIAGAVLALSFVVRGLGDMSSLQNGGLGWLSWLSPLGWSQLTAPFALDRWWPLWLTLALTAVLVPLAMALQSRRDLAAGMLPDRFGRAHASPRLNNAFALCLRLQRAGLVWWSLGIAVMGVIFGLFTAPMRDDAQGMPPAITELMGGPEGIVDGYLGFMALYFVMIVSVYGLLSAAGLRGEEQSLRAEPVLAASVSRSTWVFSWSAAVVLGSLWLMVLAGFGEGLGAAASTGDWSLLWSALLGHLAQTPSALVLSGLVVALYGLAPRLQGLAWLVFIYSAFIALFGQMLRFDQKILDTSLFVHIGQYPAQDLNTTALTLMLGAAVVLFGIGSVGFRRRNLTSNK